MEEQFDFEKLTNELLNTIHPLKCYIKGFIELPNMLSDLDLDKLQGFFQNTFINVSSKYI